MPFYPYCRGDKKDEARTPISSRATADILQVDRVVTMDLHPAQQQGFETNKTNSSRQYLFIRNNKKIFREKEF